MDINQTWYNTRKNLLRQIRDQVQLRLGPLPADLRRYEIEYQKCFRGSWQPSTRTALLEQIQSAQVVLSGDFHAHAQSQRGHLRLLRDLSTTRQVVVALECFESRNQRYLDHYLAHKLSEREFLQTIKWEERWQFPFSHYRPILQLARARGYQVVGINRFRARRTRLTLMERDDFSAKKIAKVIAEDPNCLVFAIYGELHLAYPHLPKKLAKLVPGRLIVVHQNADSLYFRLAKQGMENRIDVLRRNASTFCLNETPPWIKWQSYLMHLESTFDVDLDDEESDGPDFTDHVSAFVRWAARDLDFEVAVDNLAVYADFSVLRRQVRGKLFGSRDWKVCARLVEQQKSFLVPDLGLAYLSRSSINHAATLAGYHLHASVSSRRRMAREFPKDLQAAIWIEAVAFFISKLINPKRKIDSDEDTRLKLQSLGRARGAAAVLKIAIGEKWAQLRPKNRVRKKKLSSDPMVYLQAAILLGQRMGEEMYLRWRSGDLQLTEVRRWLRLNPFAVEFRTRFAEIGLRLRSRARSQV